MVIDAAFCTSLPKGHILPGVSSEEKEWVQVHITDN